MKSLTTSMLVVLPRLTGELTAGEDGSMDVILVLFQFIYSPTLAASSRRIRSGALPGAALWSPPEWSSHRQNRHL